MKYIYFLALLLWVSFGTSCSSFEGNKVVKRSSASILSCDSAAVSSGFDFLEALNNQWSDYIYNDLGQLSAPEMGADLERSPAQADKCVIRLNYSCTDKINDSCLDKGYCQRIKNWCYAYTQEKGRKFNSAAEIQAKYKRDPGSFEKGFSLARFTADWQRCQSGVWSAAYASNSKNQTAKPNEKIIGGDDVVKNKITGNQIFGTVKDPNSVGRPFCMNQTDDGKPVPLGFTAEKTATAKGKSSQCLVTAKQMYDLWSGQISTRAGRSLKKFDPWAPQGVEPWQTEKGLAYWKECAESKLTFDVIPSVDALVNYVNKQNPKVSLKRSDLIDENFPDGDVLAQKAEANDPTKYAISCELLEGKACLNARPRLRAGVAKFDGEDDASAIYRILKSATGAPDKLTFISDNSARDNTMTGYVSGTSFGFDGDVGKKVGIDREDYLKTCGSSDPNEFKDMIQTYRDTQENIATGVEITSTIVLAALTGGLSVEVSLGARLAVLAETQAVRALTVAEAAELSQLLVTAGRITFASEVLWFGGGSGVKTYNETGSMTAAAESLVINVATLGAFRGASKLMGKGLSKAAQTKIAQETITKAQRFIPQAEGKNVMVALTYKGLTKIVTELAPHVPAATLIFVTSCAMDKKCDWNTVVKTLGITASGIISGKIAQGMFPSLKAKFVNMPNNGKTINREPTMEDYKALNLSPKDLDGKTATEAEKIISRAFRKVVVDTKIHPDVLIGGKASAAQIELASAKFRKLAEIKELLILKYSSAASASAPVSEGSTTTSSKPAERDFSGFDKIAKYEKQIVESRLSNRTDREFLDYRRRLLQQQLSEMRGADMNTNLKGDQLTKIRRSIKENETELSQVQKQIDSLDQQVKMSDSSGKFLSAAPKSSTSDVEIMLKEEGLNTNIVQIIMKPENSVLAANLERNPEIRKVFVDLIKNSENSIQLQKDIVRFLDPQKPARAQFMNKMLQEINNQQIDVLKKSTIERAKEVIKSDCDAR